MWRPCEIRKWPSTSSCVMYSICNCLRGVINCIKCFMWLVLRIVPDREMSCSGLSHSTCFVMTTGQVLQSAWRHSVWFLQHSAPLNVASSKAREDTYSIYPVKTVRRNILYCSMRKDEAVGSFRSTIEESSRGLIRGRLKTPTNNLPPTAISHSSCVPTSHQELS